MVVCLRAVAGALLFWGEVEAAAWFESWFQLRTVWTRVQTLTPPLRDILSLPPQWSDGSLPQGCFEDDTQHGTRQVVRFSAR